MNASGNNNRVAGDLLRQFGPEKVSVMSLQDAADCFKERDCLLLSGGSDLAYQAAARPYLASLSFPLCSILHAVKWDTLFASYAYTKILCEPYDQLVATSAAGKKALEIIFREANRIMGNPGRTDADAGNSPLGISQIPLGVDERYFSGGDREQARREFGIPQESTVLLYLGRLTEQFKADLEPLLIATSRLVREDPNVLLVLSGQDTREIYTQLLEEFGSMIGISKNLKIIPNLAPKLKPLLYSAADIFVSPVDNIQETFGLTLLEAMAMERPVVASDWSGYRDIVRDGKEGFLIPTYWSSPSAETAGRFATVMTASNEHYLAQRTIVDTGILYDRLHLLVTSPALRRQFGAAGRARVLAEFTWRATALKFGDLWLQQLEACRSHALRLSPRNRPSFDYDAIFRHYASDVLDEEHTIELDRTIPNSGQLLHDRISCIASESVAAAALHLVNECSSGPKRIRDIRHYKSRITQDAILFLLKKGYCHIRAGHQLEVQLTSPGREKSAAE
ncbi:MAG: glycosyltransferase family 4 protein [Acidobacteriia bacterium]|nr:glycosyltransferase family 4 protein [Terriglobia bacterium]